MDRATLERRLAAVSGFDFPDATREQYPTPPDVAAHLLYRGALSGDIRDRVVVDLGSGTGMLALGAALLGPARVVGVERDPAAVETARENENRVDPPTPVEWAVGDVRSRPVCADGVTVVANPPFGAQRGQSGADRPFLAAAAEIAAVSYTIHNAGSDAFVESFAADHGGTVEAAYRVELDVDRQFDFHTDDTATIQAEAFCIRW